MFCAFFARARRSVSRHVTANTGSFGGNRSCEVTNSLHSDVNNTQGQWKACFLVEHTGAPSAHRKLLVVRRRHGIQTQNVILFRWEYRMQCRLEISSCPIAGGAG